MSFEFFAWQNAPDTSTPITAENLNKLNQGILGVQTALGIDHGTWTPTFTTLSGETITYQNSSVSAEWYKIGSLVYFRLDWYGKITNTNNATGTAKIALTGLPTVAKWTPVTMGEKFDCFGHISGSDQDWVCMIHPDHGITFRYATGVNEDVKWEVSSSSTFQARIFISGCYLTTGWNV